MLTYRAAGIGSFVCSSLAAKLTSNSQIKAMMNASMVLHLWYLYQISFMSVRLKRPFKLYRLSWRAEPSWTVSLCFRTTLSSSACSLPSGESPNSHRTSACESNKPINKGFSDSYPPESTHPLTSRPLPHKHRSDTDEVCLFTRDEPQMTPEQTQRFYKRLLEEKGVKNITEV